jgi:hypothetical protein
MIPTQTIRKQASLNPYDSSNKATT